MTTENKLVVDFHEKGRIGIEKMKINENDAW